MHASRSGESAACAAANANANAAPRRDEDMQSLASLMSFKQSDVGNLEDFYDSEEEPGQERRGSPAHGHAPTTAGKTRPLSPTWAHWLLRADSLVARPGPAEPEPAWNRPGTGLELAWNQPGTGLELAWNQPGVPDQNQPGTSLVFQTRTSLKLAWNRPGTGLVFQTRTSLEPAWNQPGVPDQSQPGTGLEAAWKQPGVPGVEQTFGRLNQLTPVFLSSFLSFLPGKAGSPPQLTASRVPDLAWRPVSGSDFPGNSCP